ncbi:sel1 repeat family protein [Candidatus Ozemobacteraceae bacterium]|nr:sel1 repeat family protein [Candidatus Ozemobacteraceae bacterium]
MKRFLMMFWLAAASVPSFGDTWDDADAARKRGEIATYVNMLRSLAEQGDAKAKVSLGAMYLKGKGVRQDFAEAYFWLILAVRQVHTFFTECDGAASKLSPAQQQEVRERCKRWLEGLEMRRKLQQTLATGTRRWPEANEQYE